MRTKKIGMACIGALCIFVVLAASTSASSIVSEAPIYIDGEPVTTEYSMQNGHLMVPASFLQHAGVTVEWNEQYEAVAFAKNGIIVGLQDGTNVADVFVNNHWQRDYLASTTTGIEEHSYVPFIYVVQKLGMSVSYDPQAQKTYVQTANGTANVETTNTYAANGDANVQEDLHWFYQVTEAEAGGESYTGKVAVAATILNRVEDPEWPNTINDVIFEVATYNGIDYYQYSPVLDERIYNVTPSEDTVNAVHQALDGDDPRDGALVFFNPDKTDNEWVRSRPVTTVIGNHVFAE